MLYAPDFWTPPTSLCTIKPFKKWQKTAQAILRFLILGFGKSLLKIPDILCLKMVRKSLILQGLTGMPLLTCTRVT